MMYFLFHLSANMPDGTSDTNAIKLQRENSNEISVSDKPFSLKRTAYNAYIGRQSFNNL